MRSFLLALLVVCFLGCEVPDSGNGNGTCKPPQMIAFTATWCAPCKQQSSLVDQIEASGVRVTRIDIDQRPDLAAQYRVTAVPTYFYYECNKPALRTNQANDVLARIRAWRRGG